MAETYETRLRALVERDVFQAGTRPIKDGRTIAIEVAGQTFTLTKQGGRALIQGTAPSQPDLTFVVPAGALGRLEACPATSIGDVGIEIAKLLLENDTNLRMHTKVRVGLFDMARYGYLGVLPLGGPAFMKFLSAKGFGSMSKIRTVISNLRG